MVARGCAATPGKITKAPSILKGCEKEICSRIPSGCSRLRGQFQGLLEQPVATFSHPFGVFALI
jgi:hypothetical protein